MTDTPPAFRSPHDWNLPNSILARIWRISEPNVLRLRKAAGNPAPRWDFRRDFTREHPDYLAAVAAEEGRADRAATDSGDPLKLP